MIFSKKAKLFSKVFERKTWKDFSKRVRTLTLPKLKSRKPVREKNTEAKSQKTFDQTMEDKIETDDVLLKATSNHNLIFDVVDQQNFLNTC